MEIGELVAVGFLQEQLDEQCPFSEDVTGASEEDSEDIEEDDRDSVSSQQANNGGVLGQNLTSGSAGKSGTVGGPFPPPEYTESAQDSKRSKLAAFVPGADEIDAGTYPFVVAAHHLIPGEAALAPSDLSSYMKKGSSVTTVEGNTYKLKDYIGYNVNGSHNGVWLPGNYAIRATASPWQRTPAVGHSWGDLGKHPWCLHYVAAVSKVAGAQFHDAHTKYSEAVEKLLNAIALKLFAHQDVCQQCKDKSGGEIPPPFLVKERLYNLSTYFRGQLRGSPLAWRRPWFTSDRWREEIFSGAKPSSAFVDAYERARAGGGD